jgi:hypothetical protein
MAKVMCSFDAWKEGKVAPAAVEIPVIDPPPEETKKH